MEKIKKILISNRYKDLITDLSIDLFKKIPISLNVFEFCKKHQINPIISELRHSYFWDGGISCCTQDLRRRGGLETYL